MRHPEGQLDDYYIEFDRDMGENFSEYRFDPRGIPLVDYGGELHYNPVTISQFALANLSLWHRTGHEIQRERFLTQCRWLVDQAEKTEGGFLAWHYRMDVPFYKISAPWISGMAQGQAISALLRAHQLTGKKEYALVAAEAFPCFDRSVDDGGVASRFPDGTLVIEEWPSQPPSCVLNGFAFALLGIYDYWRATGESHAEELFRRGVHGLRRNINRYDTGYWTVYDLWSPRRLASREYHRLHIRQLMVLHRIAEEETFMKYAHTWAGYQRNALCVLRWMVRKSFDKGRTIVENLLRTENG